MNKTNLAVFNLCIEHRTDLRFKKENQVQKLFQKKILNCLRPVIRSLGWKKILSAFLSYNLTASQWFFVALTESNSCTAQFQSQAKAKWPNCLCFKKKRSLSEQKEMLQGVFFLKCKVPEAVFLISRSPGKLGQRSQRAGGQCAVSAGWCDACHRRRKALLETFEDKCMQIQKSVSLDAVQGDVPLLLISIL